MEKCRIGITLGDVSGVGPEVAVKALMDPSIDARCIPILIGELSVVKHYVDRLVPHRHIRSLEDTSEATSDPTTIQLVDLKNIALPNVKLGQVLEGMRPGGP